MPTYEYECKSCKYNFDVFQSIKDDPVKICPKCGKEVRRLINGGTGIIFKGGGFYVTDKGGKGGSAAKRDEGAKKGGDAKDAARAGGAENSACSGCPKAGGGEAGPTCPKASGQ